MSLPESKLEPEGPNTLSFQQRAEQVYDALATKLAEQDALRRFANEIISASYEGGSFEGGDIQDMAVKHGLLRIESRAEECGEVCACREYGFPAECYRKTWILSASADPSVPKCKYCGDTGQIMVGRSGDYNDGNAPIMEPCEDCEPSAPVERDERNIPSDFDIFRADLADHCAALERKP